MHYKITKIDYEILNLIPDALILVEDSTKGDLLPDQNAQIIFANQFACELMGSNQEQIQGSLFRNFFTNITKSNSIQPSDGNRILFDATMSGKDIPASPVCFYLTKHDEMRFITLHTSTETIRSELILRNAYESLSRAQHIAHIGNWDWNIVKNTLWWSDEIYNIFGLNKNQFGATYDAFLESVHPDDRQIVQEKVNHALTDKTTYHVRHRVIKPGGEERLIQELGDVEYDHDGNPIRMIGTVQDITDFQSWEEHLDLVYRILNNSVEGIIISNARTEIEYVNPAYSIITGYSKAESLGKKTTILKSNAHDKKFYADMWNTLTENGIWEGELWNRKKSGHAYLQKTTLLAVHNKGGNIAKFISIFHDMTEINTPQSKDQHIQNIDILTGLPNSIVFRDRLEQAIRSASQGGPQPIIFMIGLDRIKRVNESLGYSSGDLLIKALSNKIVALRNNEDTVVRWGGDEFAILLTSPNPDLDALRSALAIIKACSHPEIIEDIEIRPSVSVGVAIYPADGHTSDTLITNASTALNNAKREGGERYLFYTPGMNEATRERLIIESELTVALEKNAIVPFYQPKLDLKTGQITGMEALARWIHPDRGIIMPDVFIPVAEKTDLIINIGQKIAERACRDLSDLKKRIGKSLQVSVNISSRQLLEPDFPRQILDLKKNYGLDDGELELEITESSLINFKNHPGIMLKKLSDSGISFALDDFGTGYSSLSYLSRLKFDSLKIDKSFIGRLDNNQDEDGIVAAIVAMSQKMKMSTIAEGVENKEQLNILQKIGCTEIQGYYISRPISFSDFIVFIENYSLQ